MYRQLDDTSSRMRLVVAHGTVWAGSEAMPCNIFLPWRPTWLQKSALWARYLTQL